MFTWCSVVFNVCIIYFLYLQWRIRFLLFDIIILFYFILFYFFCFYIYFLFFILCFLVIVSHFLLLLLYIFSSVSFHFISLNASLQSQ